MTGRQKKLTAAVLRQYGEFARRAAVDHPETEPDAYQLRHEISTILLDLERPQRNPRKAIKHDDAAGRFLDYLIGKHAWRSGPIGTFLNQCLAPCFRDRAHRIVKALLDEYRVWKATERRKARV